MQPHPFGLWNGLSESLVEMERKNPELLPDVRAGGEIVVASDYSGQNKGAYQALSFVFLHLPGNEDWERRRIEFRSRYLPVDEQMSYKDLAPGHQKDRALFPFLEAADTIKGLCITFLMSRTVKSVFVGEDAAYLQAALARFADWKPKPFEKLCRVTSLIGFMLAGLTLNSPAKFRNPPL